MTNSQQIILTYLKTKNITEFRMLTDYKVEAEGQLYIHFFQP